MVLQQNEKDKEEKYKIKIIETCIIKELLQENTKAQERFDAETNIADLLEKLMNDLNGDYV